MEVNFIKKLTKLSTKKIHKKVCNFLAKNGYKNFVSSNSFIIAEGDAPICLYGHIDTTLADYPPELIYDEPTRWLFSNDYIGENCQLTLYSILDLIDRANPKDKPSIILLNDNYSMQDFLKIYPENPFKKNKIKAIIQLEKFKSKEASFYNCKNKEFKKRISNYLFKQEKDYRYSDGILLGTSWNIGIVNLSIGIHLTEHEYQIKVIHLNELENTISKVSEMIEDSYFWDYYTYF